MVLQIHKNYKDCDMHEHDVFKRYAAALLSQIPVYNKYLE